MSTTLVQTTSDRTSRNQQRGDLMTGPAPHLTGSLGFDGICSNCIAETMSITAATPLPSTWGMMLFGLGVLGFMGYRRKNRPTPSAAQTTTR